MTAGSYTPAWYERRRAAVRRSAARILPIVFDLVHPRSVIDVGCGTGTWLAEASALGVQTVMGLDGSHVAPGQLEIPAECFTAIDLAGPFSSAAFRSDLAICLEVVEHLPPERGPEIVKLLCALAPVALFSAAVPHQPGNGHVNCRWQSYWASLFEAQGYQAIDCVRTEVWSDPAVSWWYRQNVILYVEPTYSERLAPALWESRARGWPLDLVHPGHHEYGR